MKILFFLILFLSLNCYAYNDADEIATNYVAGNFLIYDCKEKHWTCVNKRDHSACLAKQKKDLQSEKVRVQCVSFGEFPVKRSCFQKQLYLVSQNWSTRGCIQDRWREKEVKL